MAAKPVTVTRDREADTLTYQPEWAKEATVVKMEHVFSAANRIMEQKDKTEASLHFLEHIVKSYGDNFPGTLDSYAVSGLAALLGCIADASVASGDDYKDGLHAIEHMSAQYRRG